MAETTPPTRPAASSPPAETSAPTEAVEKIDPSTTGDPLPGEGEGEEESAGEGESAGGEGEAGETEGGEGGEEPASQPSGKVKLTIDGTEEELDAGEVAEAVKLCRGYEKELAEHKGWKEEATRVFQRILDDPITALLSAYQAQLGGDVEAAENLLAKHTSKFHQQRWAYNELPESEKKLRKLQQENERLKKAEAERQAALEREKAERGQLERVQQISKETAEGLKAAGLPSSPQLMGTVGRVLINARAEGYDITVAQAVGLVRDQVKKEVEERRKELGGDAAALSGLFPDLAARMRKELLEEAKQKSSARKPVPKRELPGETKPPAHKSYGDVMEHLGINR